MRLSLVNCTTTLSPVVSCVSILVRLIVIAFPHQQRGVGARLIPSLVVLKPTRYDFDFGDGDVLNAGVRIADRIVHTSVISTDTVSFGLRLGTFSPRSPLTAIQISSQVPDDIILRLFLETTRNITHPARIIYLLNRPLARELSCHTGSHVCVYVVHDGTCLLLGAQLRQTL